MSQLRIWWVISAVALLVGCSQSPPQPQSSPPETKRQPAADDTREIVVGGLYAVQTEDGTFLIMKVLAVDDFAVHLRTYANRLKECPTDIDPSTLTLGSINDPNGFGIGHFPMAKEGFFNDNPVFIKEVPVTDDELEGYRLYLEAMGG